MSTRQKPLLRPDIIDSALSKNIGKPLRAEKYEQYGACYVEVVKIESMLNNANQVIFGRRGSGKTHFLGALRDELKSNPLNHKALSVHLFANEFSVSPPGITETSTNKEKAYAFFQVFIEELATKLTEEVEEHLAKHTFLTRIKNAGTRSQIETKLIELLDISKKGEPFWSIRSATWEAESISEETSTSGSSLALGARLSSRLPLSVAASYVSEGKESLKTASKQKQKATGVFRGSALRRNLHELVRLLGIDYLLIIIDEWMALDPTSSTSVQPEFAELLRRCLFGSKHIAVKIGSNWYQTKFSNRAESHMYRGIELGQDITMVADLDLPILSNSELLDFYSCLLFKRLRLWEPSIQFFASKDDKDKPDSIFTESIFKNQDTFLELIKGGEGNPRDFLSIFEEATKKIETDVTKKRLDLQTIQACIREKSVQDKTKDLGKGTAGDHLLFNCIKPIVEEQNKRLFFVTKDSADIFFDAIEQLLNKRLIHEYHESRLDPSLRNKYLAYLLDYGTYIDWLRAIQYHSGETGETKATCGIDAKNVKSFVLDEKKMQDYYHREMKECRRCGAKFSVEQRPYRIKKLCPECFEPANEVV